MEADSGEEASAAEASAAGQERCIRQFALIADRNAKFLSSQQKASQSIAKSAI